MRRLILLMLFGPMFLGCNANGAGPEPSLEAAAPAPAAEAAPPVVPRAEPAPAPLQPTQGPWLQHLHDEAGALVADFSPPLGATDMRPVVVALHGGGDAPEYACGEWRGTFGPWPFILCPYGVKVGRRLYGWSSGAQARQAVERALAAFRLKFPAHLELRDPILAGFSRGSMIAPSTLAQGGTVFPAAVLVEGHSKDFPSFPKKMEAAGLRRLLFVDSQGGNRLRAAADVKSLQRSTAVQARAIYVGHLGHGFFPKTAEGVRKGMAELLEGLPGWERFPYPPIEPN